MSQDNDSQDSPKTPREEMEVRLTALLLGELSAEEEGTLRAAMAQDAELAQLHDRLSRTIGLVREAAGSLNDAAAPTAEPLKLSSERREKLLESFKIVRPKELAKRRVVNWREWAAIAAMVVGLLVVGGVLMMRSEDGIFAGESGRGTYFARFEAKSPQRLTTIGGTGPGIAGADSPAPQRKELAGSGLAGTGFTAELWGRQGTPRQEETLGVVDEGARVLRREVDSLANPDGSIVSLGFATNAVQTVTLAAADNQKLLATELYTIAPAAQISRLPGGGVNPALMLAGQTVSGGFGAVPALPATPTHDPKQPAGATARHFAAIALPTAGDALLASEGEAIQNRMAAVNFDYIPQAKQDFGTAAKESKKSGEQLLTGGLRTGAGVVTGGIPQGQPAGGGGGALEFAGVSVATSERRNEEPGRSPANGPIISAFSDNVGRFDGRFAAGESIVTQNPNPKEYFFQLNADDVGGLKVPTQPSTPALDHSLFTFERGSYRGDEREYIDLNRNGRFVPTDVFSAKGAASYQPGATPQENAKPEESGLKARPIVPMADPILPTVLSADANVTALAGEDRPEAALASDRVVLHREAPKDSINWFIEATDFAIPAPTPATTASTPKPTLSPGTAVAEPDVFRSIPARPVVDGVAVAKAGGATAAVTADDSVWSLPAPAQQPASRSGKSLEDGAIAFGNATYALQPAAIPHEIVGGFMPELESKAKARLANPAPAAAPTTALPAIQIATGDLDDDGIPDLAGRRPDSSMISQSDGFTRRVESAKLAQNGKLLFDSGKLDIAEAEFEKALKLDPASAGADYYLKLTKDRKSASLENNRELAERQKVVAVEKNWMESVTTDPSPVPNAYARTNFVKTGKLATSKPVAEFGNVPLVDESTFLNGLQGVVAVDSLAVPDVVAAGTIVAAAQSATPSMPDIPTILITNAAFALPAADFENLGGVVATGLPASQDSFAKRLNQVVSRAANDPSVSARAAQPADPAAGGVYSQNAVGYSTVRVTNGYSPAALTIPPSPSVSGLASPGFGYAWRFNGASAAEAKKNSGIAQSSLAGTALNANSWGGNIAGTSTADPVASFGRDERVLFENTDKRMKQHTTKPEPNISRYTIALPQNQSLELAEKPLRLTPKVGPSVINEVLADPVISELMTHLEEPLNDFIELTDLTGNPGSGPAPTSQLEGKDRRPNIKLTTTAAAGATKGAEVLPPGLIKFADADSSQVLGLYEELTGRTVLKSPSLPTAKITMENQTPISREEAIQTLETVLALNQVTMVPQGTKFTKAVPQAQAFQEGKELENQPSEMYPESAKLVTHVVQLKNALPNEMIQVLQPFAKMPQSILTVPNTSMLIIRDYAENTKRMSELVEKFDVIPQQNFVEVVIPIQSAKAEDIAQVLGGLTANGDGSGTTVGRQQANTGLSTGGANSKGTSRSASAARLNQLLNPQQGDLFVLGQTKVIADERSNSLLIFATKQDLATISNIVQKLDPPAAKAVSEMPVPQPEINTVVNAFSTFSLNVSDVSFKLAAAALEKGQMPDPSTVRSEEFINAFDYRDPEPKGSAPVAFAWERARYPFAHNRDLLRFSIKTAASGRQPGRPLNLVLLLDNSGSMERADRVRIIQECLRVLATQLRPEDRVSVVAFARTARLWIDGLPGNQAGELVQRVGGLTPQGGTNLEDAMNLAYQTALRHFTANGINRVVLLTDGAANLGDVDPASLKKKVEAHRQQGVALDCFGIGWEGLNDDLLETLSRNGDGRYGFVNSPEAAATDFAGQLAGALQVAASDVKVQVEFNPRRVTSYRQIGYAKHQLKKEQFRDNTVDAAEIAAAEAGNALYTVEVNPSGEGPLATVRVRFKIPGTADYREHEWAVPYDGAAKALEQSTATLRLAGTASAFSEWLVSSPFSGEVTPDRLLSLLSGVPESFSADPRPKKLEWMLRQAKSLAGR